jgi:FkbM family methyltransferase
MLKVLRALIRSELRGSTRLTTWLIQRLPSLHCAPVCVDNLPVVFMDLRHPTSQQWLAATRWGVGERRAMDRFVKPGQVVFDIGANVGLHTAYLSRLVGQLGKVFAFEPNPALKQGLSRTCESLGNAHLFPIALSNKSGQVQLFVPADHTMASLRKWQPAIGVECKAYPLDYLKLPQPSFIKCDVEGAELDVFQGATGVLNRPDAPIVLFEVNQHNVAGFGRGVTAAIDFLKGLQAGYQFFEIAEEDGAVSPLGEVSCTNVLAIPASITTESEIFR